MNRLGLEFVERRGGRRWGRDDEPVLGSAFMVRSVAGGSANAEHLHGVSAAPSNKTAAFMRVH